MNALLLGLTLAASPADFPLVPVHRPMLEGYALGVKARSPQEVLQPTTVRFGRRWAGFKYEDVEWALWLSPEAVSRWLGFLEARELFGQDEMLRRWRLLREDLDGKLVFVVRLSAFPKAQTLELGDPEDARPDEIQDATFALSSGDRRWPTRSTPLAFWRTQTREELDSYRWWLDLPFGDLLTPAEQWRNPEPRWNLGDWAGAWYLVEASPPPTWFEDEAFTLHVVGPRAERRATYALAPHEE